MVESAALLVDDVFPQQAIRQWVLSVPFPLRFLFARYPEVMTKALAIIHRCISTHLCQKAGYTRKSAQAGAVTLIQRFGSGLNLNVHFHMLFLDGVYAALGHNGSLLFCQVKAPNMDELNRLVYQISQRLARYLERQGLLVQDQESAYLALEDFDDNPMNDIVGHSITYRIAMGPWQGQKVMRLQNLPPKVGEDNGLSRVAKVSGFSLHAGVVALPHERKKLERVCRYIAL